MPISEVTKRNIFEVFDKVSWYGRLEENEFLSRIYDLETLPSTDQRFDNAGADIWQHRINNFDWEDDWVFYDERFGLSNGEDHVLLRFLCETLHPMVRSNTNLNGI